MSIDPGPQRPDLLGFFVQGFFGAILGGLVGLGLYLRSPVYHSDNSAVSLWLHIGVGALVIGVIAGLYGDRFWRNLKSWWF